MLAVWDSYLPTLDSNAFQSLVDFPRALLYTLSKAIQGLGPRGFQTEGPAGWSTGAGASTKMN